MNQTLELSAEAREAAKRTLQASAVGVLTLVRSTDLTKEY